MFFLGLCKQDLFSASSSTHPNNLSWLSDSSDLERAIHQRRVSSSFHVFVSTRGSWGGIFVDRPMGHEKCLRRSDFESAINGFFFCSKRMYKLLGIDCTKMKIKNFITIRTQFRSVIWHDGRNGLNYIQIFNNSCCFRFCIVKVINIFMI